MIRRLHSHSLKIRDSEKSLEFYVNRLGMIIVGHTQGIGREPDRYYLSFGEIDATRLELICDRQDTAIVYEHDDGDLYWKTGITVPDVDIARERLHFSGVEVSEPGQFGEIGYMCHLTDPDGYIIELLQHSFGQNEVSIEPDPDLRLGVAATLAHITLRAKNPAVTIPFYRDLLGMRLLSQQVVDPPGFTLYFLAYTDEMPPSGGIHAVEDREWVWQRPYTLIELQHVRGTENTEFEYHTDEDGPLGFRGITIFATDRAEVYRRAKSFTFKVESPRDGGLLRTDAPLILRDPDGTLIRIIDRE